MIQTLVKKDISTYNADCQWGSREANNPLGSREEKNPQGDDNPLKGL